MRYLGGFALLALWLVLAWRWRKDIHPAQHERQSDKCGG